MHELSIAQALVEAACEAAGDSGESRVSRLFLRIGALSGVVPEALRFSFDVAAAETACEGAALEIEFVPLSVHCPKCDATRVLPDMYSFPCPVCGGATTILTGRELDLARLELVDHDPRIVELRAKILKKNDELARQLRREFAAAGVLVVNVVSGPGAGKTELLTRTLRALGERYSVAAVVGDLATDNDAARLAKSGAHVRQILTGTMCHLEADMVRDAIAAWDLQSLDFLMIENVGNLVCPASWDLGEDLRVLLCSATEGEDKPLKYPTLINTADLVALSKMDLAAAVEFDVELAEANIQRVRPGVDSLRVSAKTGQGMEEWLAFLESRWREKKSQPREKEVLPAALSET